jgi:hypothetical protein
MVYNLQVNEKSYRRLIVATPGLSTALVPNLVFFPPCENQMLAIARSPAR